MGPCGGRFFPPPALGDWFRDGFMILGGGSSTPPPVWPSRPSVIISRWDRPLSGVLFCYQDWSKWIKVTHKAPLLPPLSSFSPPPPPPPPRLPHPPPLPISLARPGECTMNVVSFEGRHLHLNKGVSRVARRQDGGVTSVHCSPPSVKSQRVMRRRLIYNTPLKQRPYRGTDHLLSTSRELPLKEDKRRDLNL